MKYSQKKTNSLKEGEGGVPGPTFKLWEGSRVPLLNIEGGPRVPRSRGPGSTFTPCP